MQNHHLSCDVLVAGGGIAGVVCAIAAARARSTVVLCQDRPVLGGNASSEIRMHICGADCSGGRGAPLETEAREGGIIEEIRLETSVRNPQRSPSMMDLILYEKCCAEPRLTLMLNTAVVGATVEKNTIRQAVAERQSTEDRFFIEAKVFVDCTGDGRLGVEAGAPFRQGREGAGEFAETSAPPEPDKMTLGSSLLFQARDMGRPVPFVPPSWARRFTEDDLRLRAHAQAGVDRGLEYGYWWIEWGGHLDTIKDNEKIRDELLAVLLGVWDHIKNGGDHGADNWALEWFGFLPGKRENRRFIGHYILRETDLVESRTFEDAVAFGGWPIDTHPPGGIDAANERPCSQRPLPYLYDIPLRCCVSQRVSNLMFAGRNISATHAAFASTRVMATCASIGQGVGVAAACAARHRCPPDELTKRSDLIFEIQQQLLRDDAFLIGHANQDEQDLARKATPTASSAQTSGYPHWILSGVTRSTHGPKGAPPGRAVPGSHRWMSQPAAGLPAWVCLRWDEPVRFQEIRLVFDTGLHRPLTLTHSDAFAQRMLWGRPQPETVRDYSIELEQAGEWNTVHEERGNYQRLRIHRFAVAQETAAIRITVRATNGLDHARICEIRVY